MRIFYCFLLMFFTVACGGTGPQSQLNALGKEEVRYAKGFTLSYFDGYTVADVINPWDTTKLLHRYILVDKAGDLPDSLPQGTVVRVPVESVVPATSVHSSLLKALGCVDNIVGVCDPQYISIPEIREGVENGTIVDIGKSYMPNVEKLVLCRPEIIIMPPFENQGYGGVEKTDIPIVECASYMELQPLGQAEWIKFHAAFYGKQQLADSLFNEMEQRYIAVKEMAQEAEGKPVLLPEKQFGQVWYVPGGGSYAANLYKDAGAFYPWKADSSRGSLALSFEGVYEVASDADIWLIRYNDAEYDMTYESLKSENPLYELLKPFKEKKVYVCNTAKVPYYETAQLQPDIVLKDLVKILHPELLPDYTPYYYHLMTE